MRALAIMFMAVLLVGVFAVGPGSALATPTDWTVNGKPLAPGEEVAVKFASSSPIELIVPALKFRITCKSWTAKGKLDGGEIGTGRLVIPKLSGCVEPEEKAKVHFRFRKGRFGVTTDKKHEKGAQDTTELEVPKGQATLVVEPDFTKGRKEEFEMAGIIDAFGPGPERENLLEFPKPELLTTTLEVGGQRAELVGKAAFNLPGHAKLSQGEL
jgi:hypothetical protein